MLVVDDDKEVLFDPPHVWLCQLSRMLGFNFWHTSLNDV